MTGFCCVLSYVSLWYLVFGILKTRGIVRGKIRADYWSVASFDNFNCLVIMVVEVMVVLPDLSIVVLYILLKVINTQPCVQQRTKNA